MSKRVLIMAGGTGGHVFPALATADELRSRGVVVEWLGTEKGIEARVVPNASIKLHFITITGVRGKNIQTLLKAPFLLLMAIGQAVSIIREFKPDCVLGMGGFASGPGGVAAWLLRVPLVIQEQNAIAGTTNKILSFFAKKIMLGFPDAIVSRKAEFSGNPIRKEICNLPAPDETVAAGEKLKVLVLGGSLGAQAINQLVPAALAKLAEDIRPDVWHQSGEKHLQDTEQAYRENHIENAKITAFITDMAEAYQWADFVICRAGALTVAELACAGRGSLLIPFPYAIDDHQTANALWLEQAGAAKVFQQSEIDVDALAARLEYRSRHRDEVRDMARIARRLSRPEAAKTVADCCLELAS